LVTAAQKRAVYSSSVIPRAACCAGSGPDFHSSSVIPRAACCAGSGPDFPFLDRQNRKDLRHAVEHSSPAMNIDPGCRRRKIGYMHPGFGDPQPLRSVLKKRG
jgi:hypothetical protein